MSSLLQLQTVKHLGAQCPYVEAIVSSPKDYHSIPPTQFPFLVHHAMKAHKHSYGGCKWSVSSSDSFTISRLTP
jgi:hypothetical protein